MSEHRDKTAAKPSEQTVIDLVVIGVAAVVLFALAMWLDVFELFVEWSRDYEHLQIDELVSAAVILLVAVAIFAARRWRELRGELLWRQQAEEELRRADRLEGALLAARTLQHELNNTLALTVGYADMLTRTPDLPDNAREAAAQALRGAEEAVASVKRLQGLTDLEEQSWGEGVSSTLRPSGR